MIEREQVRSPDKLHTRPFDAILVHGYWLSEVGKNKARLGWRGNLAVRAAALAYDEGRGARNIVLTEGHVWGPDYPSGAELMAKKLQNMYHVPEEAIIVKGDAYSTGGEVEICMELAHEKGWTSLLDIAASKHLWTIPGIFKKMGENVQFRSVEEILREQNDPRMNSILKKLGKSKYEFALMFYEAGIWTAMHLLNLDYKTLENRNKSKRTVKGKDFIIPTDVYKT